MDTYSRYSLFNLSESRADVHRQGYITIDGQEHLLDYPVQMSFSNTPEGRAAIAAEIPEPFLSAVLLVWGAEPGAGEE